MRFCLVLAALVLATSPAIAQSPQTYYWCDATRAWFPNVRTCPLPWRAVVVKPQEPLQPPTQLLPPRPEAETSRTKPVAQGPAIPQLGDGLDEWCSQVKLTRSIALCSSAELRTLASERQRAFDEARARLNPDQQKILLADQKEWVQSYAKSCGLSDDAPPSLPLTPAVQQCMAQSGQARIAYLRAYGAASNSTAAQPVSDTNTPPQPEGNKVGSPVDISPTDTPPTLARGLTHAKSSDTNSPRPSSPERSARNVSSGSASGQPSDNGSGLAGLLALLVIVALPIGLIIWAQETKKKRLRDKVLGAVRDLVHQHMRALVRKRFQTFKNDDYNNPVIEPWMKEMEYFIKTVIEPRMQQMARREYQMYQTKVQPTILGLIEQLVGAQAGSSANRITFGPNTTPIDFENYCAQQLRSAGWSADTTKATGDQGTDIVASKGDLRLVVQCKLYNHPVGNKAVQEIAAARTHQKADYAAVVSNARYTSAARELAATNGVLLLHHIDLRNIDDLLGEGGEEPKLVAGAPVLNKI